MLILSMALAHLKIGCDIWRHIPSIRGDPREDCRAPLVFCQTRRCRFVSARCGGQFARPGICRRTPWRIGYIVNWSTHTYPMHKYVTRYMNTRNVWDGWHSRFNCNIYTLNVKRNARKLICCSHWRKSPKIHCNPLHILCTSYTCSSNAFNKC